MSVSHAKQSRGFLDSVAGDTGNGGVEFEISIGSRFEKILTAFEVFADWLTVVIAVDFGYLVYGLFNLGRRVDHNLVTAIYVPFAVAGLMVVLLDRDGAYRPGNSLLRIKETERSLRVSAQAFVLTLPVAIFFSRLLPCWAFVIAMCSVPVLQAIEKHTLFIAVGALRARNAEAQKVLIYGAGESGRRILSALLRSPKLGLKPIAAIDDDVHLNGQEVFEYAYRRGRSVKVISGPVTPELLQHHDCYLLIIAIPSLGREKFSGAVNAAQAAGVRLAYVPGQAIAAEYWTEYADIDGILLSVFGRPASKWQYETGKMLFDLAAAAALIALFAPLWLLIALMIRLESLGPVFFRQTRVGKNGKLFTLYKFRSMHVDTPKYEVSPTDSGDPRITRIGRILRRTSLDELPQLINVLKGNMSLVGPRPEMPFIAEQYTTVHRQRLRVTPGITGLWQLSADRAFKIHENIQYDLYYIRYRSFFMDFAILLHTFLFAMNGI